MRRIHMMFELQRNVHELVQQCRQGVTRRMAESFDSWNCQECVQKKKKEVVKERNKKRARERKEAKESKEGEDAPANGDAGEPPAKKMKQSKKSIEPAAKSAAKTASKAASKSASKSKSEKKSSSRKRSRRAICLSVGSVADIHLCRTRCFHGPNVK